MRWNEIAGVWNTTGRAVSTLQQSVINHDFVQQSFQTFVLSQLNCNRWAFLNYPSCEMCTFSEYCTEILVSSLQDPFALSWCSEMKTVLYGGKKSKWGIWVMAQMCHLKCFHIWAFSFVSVSIDLYQNRAKSYLLCFWLYWHVLMPLRVHPRLDERNSWSCWWGQGDRICPIWTFLYY